MAALRKRSLIVIAVIILVIAIVLSSFVYLNAQKPYTGNFESITIGMVPNENLAPIYIADNQHYFIANGLNVTIKNYISGGDAIDGLLSGDAEVALAGEYVLVAKSLTNASICTFGSLTKGESVFLVGRTDLGINNIQDLKGKTVGVASGTSGEFYFGRFLQLNGMDLSQVTKVNVPLGQSPNALANGTVAAVVSIPPYVTSIQNQFENSSITWSVQSGQPYYADGVCTKAYAAAHPDLIVRFLKAIVQADSYISNNQKNAMAIVANKLNYTGSYLATVWTDFQFSLSLDQSQVAALQDEAQWQINNNLTNVTTVPNVINYIYVDGLKSVKPGAVNIIG